jgi:hypothetical protein
VPLVPSLMREKQKARWDFLFWCLRTLSVLAVAEILVGLVTRNWLLVPDAILWFVEYTLGLRPE